MGKTILQKILEGAGYVRDTEYRGPNIAYVRFDDITKKLNAERFFLTQDQTKCFRQYTDEVLDTNLLIRKYPTLFKEYIGQTNLWQLVKDVSKNTWNEKYDSVEDKEAEIAHRDFFIAMQADADKTENELCIEIVDRYPNCNEKMKELLAREEARRRISEAVWWKEHRARIEYQIAEEMKNNPHFTYETARDRAINIVRQDMDGVHGKIKIALITAGSIVLFVGLLIICWPLIQIFFRVVFGFGSIATNILMDNY